MIRYIILILLFIILSGATYNCHKYLNMILPNNQKTLEYKAPLLPPEVIKTLSLGYDTLIADYYWLTAIQYYGGEIRKNSENMPELYPLFDIITTLDPQFTFSYIFASYVLADWDSPTKAAIILEKGLKANPTDWEIAYQLGFIHYLYFKNYKKAAKYFEYAAKCPNAPNTPARLAAMLYNKVGEISIAKALWQQALKTAPDEHTKERIRRHLIETQIKEDIENIKIALNKYKNRILSNLNKKQSNNKTNNKSNNKVIKPTPTPTPSITNIYPSSLNELVKLGLLKEIPLDPLGREYIYDAFTGKVYNEKLPWDKD